MLGSTGSFKKNLRAGEIFSALYTLLTVGLLATSVSAETVLPAHSTFGDVEPTVPMRIFRSERINGHRAPESLLGELIFESPRLLGGMARSTGISCDTCHIRGGANPDFFIPGESTHPGTFNGAAFLFNPSSKIISGPAIVIPSLFGRADQVRFGHDGRAESLRDFVRDVIVKEFNGPEPSQYLIDTLTAYVSDIEKRPNSRINTSGELIDPTALELKGQKIFFRTFSDRDLSCATCHRPEQNFSDNVLHDIGGKRLRTPSLTDRADQMRYFHDGRSPNLQDAIQQKNADFNIGLSNDDKSALVAYVAAIGTVDRARELASVELALSDIRNARSGLRYAIDLKDNDLIAIAADGFARKLQMLSASYNAFSDDTNGASARRLAISKIADSTLALFKLRAIAEQGLQDDIETAFLNLQVKLDDMQKPVRDGAEYSLFNIERLNAYRNKIGRPLITQ